MRSTVSIVITTIVMSLFLVGCVANNNSIAPTSYPAPPTSGTSATATTATPSEAANPSLSKPPASAPALVPTPVKASVKSTVASAPVQPQANAPRLQAKIDSADFGEVAFDTMVDQTFDFTNVGTQPLILDNVAVKAEEGC